MKDVFPDTPGFNELRRKLDVGKTLIQSCSKVQSWNLLSIKQRSKEIKSLDTDLNHFIDTVLQVETFVGVGRIIRTLGQPSSDSAANPSNSNIVVGSEQLPSSYSSASSSNGHSLTLPSNIHDNKVAFRNDKSLSEYREPNGIGKTTLSSKFDLKVILPVEPETLWHDCSKHRIFGKSFLCRTVEKNLVVKKSTVRTVVKEDVPSHKAEFQEHMEMVGNISHPNVVPVRAYYFSDSNEERAMVYDYYYKRSVHHMLHGKGNRPLQWDARLKIVIGVAVGIAFIHKHDNGTLVHGNIKSPNIFLNDKDYGCISDLGQSMLFPPVLPFVREAHKHLAPEIITEYDFRSKTTQASDVYSFGTLLVELLYGEIDLSLFYSKGSSGIKDVHLRGQFDRIKKQWEGVKQIAKSCTAEVPDKRPKIDDVVERIKNAGLS